MNVGIDENSFKIFNFDLSIKFNLFSSFIRRNKQKVKMMNDEHKREEKEKIFFVLKK